MDYRDIAFSVADNRNGTWRWQLHLKIDPNVSRIVPCGHVPGDQAQAIEAAHAAIDEWLAGRGPEGDSAAVHLVTAMHVCGRSEAVTSLDG